MLLAVSAFKTGERRKIRRLISEFKFDIKLESVATHMSTVLSSVCEFLFILVFYFGGFSLRFGFLIGVDELH